MPWPLQVFATREECKARYGFVPVGACWRAKGQLPDAGNDPAALAEWTAIAHGRAFATQIQARDPLWVKLPDGSEFCVDLEPGNPKSWTVTQPQLDRLTVVPSINVAGSYHGWITDGAITDDCEGRTFPDARGFPT